MVKFGRIVDRTGRILFSCSMVLFLFVSVNCLLILVEAQGQSTEHPWPVFGHDSGHTGYTDSPAPRVPDSLWNFTTGGIILSPPTVANGTVFVGSFDNKTYALNQSTGQKIWEFTAYGAVTSSPAVAGGKVFFESYYQIGATRDGRAYALDQSNGNLIWSYTTGEEFFSPVVVGNVVFVARGANQICALDASTGNIIWNSTLGHFPSTSVGVGYGKVFALAADGYVYALNQYDGSMEWNYSASGSIGDIPPPSPAIAENKVFVGGLGSNKTYALDQTTGNKIWEFRTGGIVWSTPAVAYGKVFITSMDNKTYALDESTGNKIWEFETGDAILGMPAVAEGIVFVSSVKPEGWKMYALDQSNGSKIWEYTAVLGGMGLFTGNTVVADGRLYASANNTVFAFGTHNLALTNIEAPSSFTAGDTVSVNLTVQNNGDFTEDFNITLYYNSTKIETRPLSAIAPHTSRTISFSWTTTGVQANSYQLRAVIEGALKDNITADNELSRLIAANAASMAIPWEIIIPIIVAAAIIVAILIYLKKRPKKLKPPQLKISADPKEIVADGKSTSNVTIELVDAKGNPLPAIEPTMVFLNANGGSLMSSVAIPKEQYSANTPLTSSTSIGTVTITAKSKGARDASVTVAFKEKKRYCMNCGSVMPFAAKACPKCGKVPPGGQDTKACKNCKSVIPVVAKFCSECGANQPE